MKIIAVAFFIILLACAPVLAAADCHTDARIAAFTALLKTHPRRTAVESFIRHHQMRLDKAHKTSTLTVAISDADCNLMDYQHEQRVFTVTFRKSVAVDFTQTAMSGGP